MRRLFSIFDFLDIRQQSIIPWRVIKKGGYFEMQIFWAKTPSDFASFLPDLNAGVSDCCSLIPHLNNSSFTK